MLIAYIDEVGEAGAFISKDHKRFKISPAFGYAGFVVPEQHVHALSRDVAITKQKFYSLLCSDGEENPRNYAPTWERKGSDLLSKHAMGRAGRQEVIELRSLLTRISSNYGGKLFYFVREKPIGSPGQVWGKDIDNNWENKREERTLECLSEAINRLCTYAEHEEQNILLFQDMINENERYQQVRRSYAHVYSRIREHQEMRRILEAPAYIDSELSTNIQCADWIAALIGRACDYQLIPGSSYKWVAETFYRYLHGHFTYESTLQFNMRTIDNIHNIKILDRARPALDSIAGMSPENLRLLQKVHARTSAPTPRKPS
jgi:hypothetical protein